jgi:predicted ABC-type ATPase
MTKEILTLSSSLKNLVKYYLPLADRALILDNSITEAPKLIAQSIKNCFVIKDALIWKSIERLAYV